MGVVIAHEDAAADLESKPLVFRGGSATTGGPRDVDITTMALGVGDGGTAASLEASCVRKLNRNVLTVLFAVAMMCYIDRTNLAFASVSMTADLGFNAQVYGLGSGLFFVGYSLSMVPAQLILLRIGTARALSGIVTAWGATAMAFSFLSGERQFYLLRLLLGAFESGAFPAIWWVMKLPSRGVWGVFCAWLDGKRNWEKQQQQL